jgi:hypothetical protein
MVEYSLPQDAETLYAMYKELEKERLKKKGMLEEKDS